MEFNEPQSRRHFVRTINAATAATVATVVARAGMAGAVAADEVPPGKGVGSDPAHASAGAGMPAELPNLNSLKADLMVPMVGRGAAAAATTGWEETQVIPERRQARAWLAHVIHSQLPAK